MNVIARNEMVGQASSLSITDDRQDAGPTNNLPREGDCFASLAMTETMALHGSARDAPFSFPLF
jgi:hypothetical protein